MISGKLRALVEDAIYQVMDNSAFRVLIVCVLLIVALTFAFQVNEESVSFLWGVWEWDMSTVMGNTAEPQAELIDNFVTLVVRLMAGFFGVIFSIAATSFFVPRMIEKGAADMLFHKPIARWRFYVARYFSGLLFVACLSFLLVGGMFLGFAACSGYVDTGLLWSAVTLTYIFGLIYSFCMLIGVLTRSTVASILMTIVFWGVNSCVHGAWQTLEQSNEQFTDGVAFLEEQKERGQLDEVEFAEGIEALDGFSPVWAVLYRSQWGLHFVLPKTGDAAILSKRLRRALGTTLLDESDANIKIARTPSGWSQADTAPEKLDTPVLAELGEVRATAVHDDGASFVVRRRERRQIPRKTGKRTRAERFSHAQESLAEVLRANGFPDLVTGDSYPEGFRQQVSRSEAVKPPVLDRSTNERLVLSTESGHHELALFQVGNFFYSLELWVPRDGDLDTAYEIFEPIDFHVDPESWYERRFVAGAPLAFNPTFSVLSSIGFACMMLLLGIWKLSRIDF